MSQDEVLGHHPAHRSADKNDEITSTLDPELTHEVVSVLERL